MADMLAGEQKAPEVKTDKLSDLPAKGGAAPKPTAPEVASYKTAKGSEYQVHEDGTNNVQQGRTFDVGHARATRSQGSRQAFVYVSDGVEGLTSAGVEGKIPSRVIIKDGKASLLMWNEKQGKWGRAPSGTDIPVSDKPAVGLHPRELWSPKNDVPGYEAYGSMHAGNKITEVSGPKAEPAKPPIDTETLRSRLRDNDEKGTAMWSEKAVRERAAEMGLDKEAPEAKAEAPAEAVPEPEAKPAAAEAPPEEPAKQAPRPSESMPLGAKRSSSRWRGKCFADLLDQGKGGQSGQVKTADIKKEISRRLGGLTGSSDFFNSALLDLWRGKEWGLLEANDPMKFTKEELDSSIPNEIYPDINARKFAKVERGPEFSHYKENAPEEPAGPDLKTMKDFLKSVKVKTGGMSEPAVRKLYAEQAEKFQIEEKQGTSGPVPNKQSELTKMMQEQRDTMGEAERNQKGTREQMQAVGVDMHDRKPVEPGGEFGIGRGPADIGARPRPPRTIPI